MRVLRICCWFAGAVLALGAATSATAEMSRAQAMAALDQPTAGMRLAAVERLAEVGVMADAERVVARLRDADPAVRERASSALWQIWSRSGDPAVEKLFVRGVAQMAAAALDEALATFDEIVRRRPDFAEGWNKRATVYFLLGRFAESLTDVDEVLRRNPYHFGALSGAGQIHLRLGNEALALEYFRRALEVNPNLEQIEEMIPILEQRARQRRRNTV